MLNVAKGFWGTLWGPFRGTGALNSTSVPVFLPTVPEGAARVSFRKRGPGRRSGGNRASSHLFHQQSSLPLHLCCTSCCFRIHVQREKPDGSLVTSKNRTHKMSVPCSFNSWGKKGENLRKNDEKFNPRSRRSRQYSNVVLTCWVLGAVRQSYPDHRQQLEVSSLLGAGQQVLLPLIYLSLSSLPYSQVPTNALT